MRTPAHAVCWLTLLVLSVVGAGHEACAATLARRLDTIFAPTRVEHATLARDGQHLAFALRDERDLRVTIYGVDQPERSSRLRLDGPTGAPVQYLGWIAPDRLLVVIDGARLVVVDADARPVLQLDGATAFAPSGEKRSGRPVIRFAGAAVSPDTAMLEVHWLKPGGDVTLDLLSLNVRTGERRLVGSRPVEAPGGAWLLDRQGRPRVFFSFAGLQRRFFHLPVEGGRADEQPLERLVRGASAPAWQVTPRNFTGERAFPLAFADDPHVLYFASNVGRDTYGIYALDVRTGTSTGFALEEAAVDLADFMSPRADSGLIFDRARQTLAGFTPPVGAIETRWFDAELAAVQELLREKFPGRDVRVLEWDDARQLFLVRVTAPIDAGRIFLFHRGDGRCVEYQRNPALAADEANRVEPVAFVTADGEPVTGMVTWPRAGALANVKPPLVVWLHDGPLQLVPSGVQREAQALAAAGFAVAQINHRGSAGSGRRSRESLRAAFDRVPLDDVLALIATLATDERIDRGRVAIAGEGFGGYVALRALQLHPGVFRGAVAINAPLDLAQLYVPERDVAADQRAAEQRLQAGGQGSRDLLAAAGDDPSLGLPGLEAASGSGNGPPPGAGGGGPRPGGTVNFEREIARWFFGPAGRQKIAVASDLALLTQPVLLLHDPRLALPAIGPVRRLRDALVRRKQTVELVELSPQFTRGETGARAAVFRSITEFLTAHLVAAPAQSRPVVVE